MGAVRNVRIQVAYDGSPFFGWQRQDGFESVQESLEEGLAALTGEVATVHGAGRTDTGVHALRQVAHVHTSTRLDDERLLPAWNAHLPDGVAITALETCDDAFHARFGATGKRYLYSVVTGRVRPPWGRAHAHFVRDALDLGAMRRAASAMVGERDFSAFANAGSPRSSNVRRLERVRIVPRRSRFAIVVEANGFLYNMARTIAGTLLLVGRGGLSADAIGEILDSGDRKAAGPTAPACGLWMLRVRYPEPTFRAAARAGRPAPGLFRS